MYKYNKNMIEINGNTRSFKYDIQTVVEYNGTYIVLIDVAPGKTDINNIYCLDSQAKLVWKAENLEKLYPDRKIYPYVSIFVMDDEVYATDFFACEYKLDAKTGKVKSHRNLGW